MKSRWFRIYHSTLKVSALALAVVIVFESGLVSPVTSKLSQNTIIYTANLVGIGASVVPTELNTLTAELTEREQDLARRERELSVQLNSGQSTSGSSQLTTYILSALLFILLVMIVLNYSLDLARERYLRSLTKQLSHE